MEFFTPLKMPRLLITTCLLLLIPITAQAAPVQKSFVAQSCDFPGSFSSSADIAVIAELPETLPAPAGTPSPVFEITAVPSSSLRSWLRLFGGRTLEGELTMVGSLRSLPGLSTMAVSLPIPPMAIPGSGDLQITASGSALEGWLDYALPQNVDYEIDRFELALTTRNSQGNILSGSLGEFTSTCHLERQSDRHLHSFQAERFLFVGISPNFHRLQVGTSRSQSTWVRNNTGTAVALDQVTITGPDADTFHASPSCTSILPDSACEVVVTATPFGDPGERQAQLNVTMGDAQGTTLSRPLSVTAVEREYADLRIDREVVAFDEVPLGLEVLQTVTVTNAASHLSVGPGQIDLSLSGPDSGAFSLVSNCPDRDGNRVWKSCPVHVLFDATMTGPREATLAIDSAHPQAADFEIPLSATGVMEGSYGHLLGNGWLSMAAGVSPAAEAFTGELNIFTNPLRVSTMGAYSLLSMIEFVPVEPLTGRLVNGVLTAEARMQVNIPAGTHRRRVFKGPDEVLAEYGGADCTGVEPITVTLQSDTQAPFTWLWGGPVRVTYELPRFRNCDDYTTRLNWYLAGTQVDRVHGFRNLQ